MILARPFPTNGRSDPRAVSACLKLLGLALLVRVVSDISGGLLLVHSGDYFPWRHLPGVPLYSATWLQLEWTLSVACALMLLSGRWTALALRMGMVLALVSLSHRFANHRVLLFLLFLFLSLDPPTLKSYWPTGPARVSPALGLVRAQLVIVYWFSAANKCAHGFLDGQSLVHLLGTSRDVALCLAIAAVAVELALPLLLWLCPRLGIVIALGLHTSFAVALPGLWTFSVLMMSMAVLFYPPRTHSVGAKSIDSDDLEPD